MLPYWSCIASSPKARWTTPPMPGVCARPTTSAWSIRATAPSSANRPAMTNYRNARNDLLSLHELGLLVKTKQGNAYVFYAPENLRELLAELAKK